MKTKNMTILVMLTMVLAIFVYAGSPLGGGEAFPTSSVPDYSNVSGSINLSDENCLDF